MGKYDKEVKESIIAFCLLSDISIENINDIIQKNYNIIKDYYMTSISIRDVKSILLSLKNVVDRDEINNIIDYHIGEMECGKNSSEKDVIESIILLGSVALTAIVEMTNDGEAKVKEQAYKLYDKKTTAYNDVWYVRGIEGICVDINRKVARINSIYTKQSTCCDGEMLVDTFMDTLIFSAFLLVGAKYF